MLSAVDTQCTTSVCVCVFLQFSGMGFLPSTPNNLKNGVHNAPVDLSFEPYHSMYSFPSEDVQGIPTRFLVRGSTVHA